MSEHTPGPWRVRPESVGNRIVRRIVAAEYPGGHKPIATLHEGFTCSAEDAPLIAAAPELLAALKRLTAGPLGPEKVGHPAVCSCQWCEASRAIARAEGDTP